MKRNICISLRLWCLTAALLLAGLGQAQATTVSSNPANGATGVSPNTQLIFTFSGPMTTQFTFVTCSNLTAGTFIPLPGGAWSAGNTVLTITPLAAFPGNSVIAWYVVGYDAAVQPLTGPTSGTFTTGAGSGGFGTNAFTAFAVGKVHTWDQYSAGPPVLDTNAPYFFNAITTLASNRTATAITVTLPTAAVSNLTQNFVAPEMYYFFSFTTNSTAFETSFPQGTYTFFVSATASNQTVPVLLPTGMTQPPAPHITTYAAAQSVNATQAFTLGWDAFAGGTSTDYVYVAVGNAWSTAAPGAPGALSGTATSVTIPANTLQPSSNYTATVAFYHYAMVSNATYSTTAYRSTGTQFGLNTVGASAPRPVVTNYVKSGSSFSFDVITTAGQALTVVSSTNCALPLAQWPILLSTNSPGTRVHITDPRPATSRVMLYRVRNGS